MPKISRKKLRTKLIHTLLDETPQANVIPQENLEKHIYMSFDVATKSIAYCIVKMPVNPSKSYFILKKQYESIIKQLEEVRRTLDQDKLLLLEQQVNTLKQDLDEYLTILDGSVDNLIPDKKDKDISEVERIKALVKYYNNQLKPVLEKHSLGPENMIILIEHQMSPNCRARAICSALIAMFVDYEIYIVKPVLKNRINLSNDGHWINFVKQYKTLYTANKKHAIHNFEILSKDFKSELTFTKKEISHVSDAFMQVLGYLKFKK